jgi:predicted MFS family arabinose efflux permease
MFTTFAEFFAKTYGFSAGVAGLAYLGLGVGFFAATLFGAKFADQIYGYVCAYCYLSLSALIYYWNSWRRRMAASGIQRCGYLRSSLAHYSYPSACCEW